MRGQSLTVAGTVPARARFNIPQSHPLTLQWKTVGPDFYQDGTPVADGEVYALVYTKSGSVFAGFKADGTLVDGAVSELVMALPQAKDGHCVSTLCVLAKSYVSKRTTGTWELVLLDTRRADRRPAGLTETGTPARVNAWGQAQGWTVGTVPGMAMWVSDEVESER